jgi:photosynthetic reaction center cytochrome c subunit
MTRASSVTLVTSVLAVCLVANALLGAQGSAEKAPVSDVVFKNVQVMKGIPVDQFMATMGFFSASLGMSCEDCHMADDRDWSGFAVDNPRKQTTRRMIRMVQKINSDNFGGRQMVTCWSCHRGADAPRTVPDFAVQYGPLQSPDPHAPVTRSVNAAEPDDVFRAYLQAVGGAGPAAAVTSIAARGTNVGYGPEAANQRDTEIYAQASPLQRSVVVHTSNGNSTTTFAGTRAWYAAPLRPVDVLLLDGQELAAARVDAMLQFPALVARIADRWRGGAPTSVDNVDVNVVQGTTTDGVLVTLYFDQATGLLTRSIRYTDSPVGKIPVQADYSDHRAVGGVKLPFGFTTTGLNGRDTFALTDVRINVPIDGAVFARPPAATAPGAK